MSIWSSLSLLNREPLLCFSPFQLVLQAHVATERRSKHVSLVTKFLSCYYSVGLCLSIDLFHFFTGTVILFYFNMEILKAEILQLVEQMLISQTTTSTISPPLFEYLDPVDGCSTQTQISKATFPFYLQAAIQSGTHGPKQMTLSPQSVVYPQMVRQQLSYLGAQISGVKCMCCSDHDLISVF